MTPQIDHRPQRRTWWRSILNLTRMTRALCAIGAAAGALLLFTEPSEHIQRAYSVTAILCGVLVGQNIHSAREVSRINGHTTKTVGTGIEAVTDAVDDALEVTEHLENQLIGMTVAQTEAVGDVRPFTANAGTGRAERAHARRFETAHAFRSTGDDSTGGRVLPLRSSAS